MENDPTPIIGSIFGLGFIALILYLLVTAGMIALGIWITYTVIWRAVRRGMREFHGLDASGRPRLPQA